MIKTEFINLINKELEQLKEQGLYKNEYPLLSAQSAEVEIADPLTGKPRIMLNFCANNYLGLANNGELQEVAKKAIDKYGFGTASVRFICGTMDAHKEFERKMAEFLGYEDVISYSSCFAANGGVFQALLDEKDAIISANLNHASLIDGIRLCKAQRYFYQFDDMADLEDKIKEASKYAVNKLIVTDGVFSMDGDIADLNSICNLAEKYGCMVMVDDSHATGFIGPSGRGTIELCAVNQRVDILSSTLGKALGGAGGGFIASKKPIIEKLRNKSRPYLFSNNTIPAVAVVGNAILDMLNNSQHLITRLAENTLYFRGRMTKAGFKIRPGVHPIVPVMFGDAKLAASIAEALIREEGIYVIAFSFPVVPHGEARIRVQLSALHTDEQLERAINSFIKIGQKYKII